MNKSNILILDGGMGRELERRGAPFRQPEWSALAMMEAPEIVKEAHLAFIQAGSRVITTNSYALVPFHIGEEVFAQRAEKLADLAGVKAKQAVEESKTNTLVAGSLPPLFGSYRADLYQAGRVEEIATPLINGLKANVDFWLAETQSLIAEVIAVKSVVDKQCTESKPYWVSFTLEDSEETVVPLLRSGETVESAVKAMAELQVDAILFNCSQPEIIEDALTVARHTLNSLQQDQIKLGAYANAFPPQPKDATANDGLDELRADLTPPAYLVWAEKWQEQGATLIGGCCGIGPDHIQQLADHFNAIIS
ncbi:homocysteine S-methyltransferase family protein [Vibrio viridaestus]|uniref:Homocysteine S-methyltransferase family protein n=1 Tax=Vibrio viridaestus TaxID=2487322 RepID=A0A3N9U3T2_9VIBR|nr:homocysteine S-methyltransferase family protein [Vibrio viridaestus]RQW62686.1 homocysteine S-methyltransferase family protein [Vibrio viridaestus]